MFKWLIDMYNKHRRIRWIQRIRENKLKQQKQHKLIDTTTITFTINWVDGSSPAGQSVYLALIQRWENELGNKKLKIIENTYPKDEQSRLKYQMSELIKWERS